MAAAASVVRRPGFTGNSKRGQRLIIALMRLGAAQRAAADVLMAFLLRGGNGLARIGEQTDILFIACALHGGAPGSMNLGPPDGMICSVFVNVIMFHG